MSKNLLLMRHAEAGWGSGVGTDHERRLTKDGVGVAKNMGLWVKNKNVIPGYILCSTATRTQETLAALMEGGSWISDLDFKDELYSSTEDQILSLLIQKLSDSHDTVMLIGHEPKCSILTHLFTGEEDTSFSPASVAKISFEVEYWKEAQFNAGKLEWLERP